MKNFADLTLTFDFVLSISVVICLQHPPFDVTVRHLNGHISHLGSDHRNNRMTS
jgi:hypothetical protein